MPLFGDIGKGTVEEAHVVINDTIARIDPLLTKVFLMANALLNNVVDRFEINITIRVKPNPGPNPAPD